MKTADEVAHFQRHGILYLVGTETIKDHLIECLDYPTSLYEHQELHVKDCWYGDDHLHRQGPW